MGLFSREPSKPKDWGQIFFYIAIGFLLSMVALQVLVNFFTSQIKFAGPIVNGVALVLIPIIVLGILLKRIPYQTKWDFIILTAIILMVGAVLVFGPTLTPGLYSSFKMSSMASMFS